MIFGDDYIVYLMDDIPRTIEYSYFIPNDDFLNEEKQIDMDSIMSNKTWEVVERAYGCNMQDANGCFNKKYRHDGTIENYRAKLVGTSYIKKQGDDYFGTYILLD